jgi:hypothetical protein
MKTYIVLFAVGVLALAACAPAAAITPTIPPPDEPPTLPPTKMPTGTPTLPPDEPPATKTYSNAEFGLAFQYPGEWFGPEEYISGQSLRVEIGSDKVYPYGELPEEPSEVTDSYNVVVQYDKGTGAEPEILATLRGLGDGESFSTARSLVTRVRPVEIGGLQGFEYVVTLPEGAQTEWVYLREVLLYDPQTGDRLTVRGQPTNVLVEGDVWRAAYRAVEQTFLTALEDIVASISVE